MDGMERLARWYYRKRAKWNRRRRLIFPSPAELKLVELMGGKVLRFRWLRDARTNYPAAIIVSMGPHLRGERMRREVRIGKYYVDFANDIFRIIEVDGEPYHMDVVADLDREIYIKTRRPDARFLRIKGYELYRAPARVQKKVLKFLTY